MKTERSFFSFAPSYEDTSIKYSMFQRLQELFPHEHGLIEKGRFFNTILFTNNGVLDPPRIFYISGDHGFLSRCSARSVEDDRVFIEALFFSPTNLKSSMSIISKSELSTGKQTLLRCERNPNTYFAVWIDVLFMYPPFVSQEIRKINAHFS